MASVPNYIKHVSTQCCRVKQEVTGDTQLFDEGALGKTPDG